MPVLDLDTAAALAGRTDWRVDLLPVTDGADAISEVAVPLDKILVSMGNKVHRCATPS